MENLVKARVRREYEMLLAKRTGDPLESLAALSDIQIEKMLLSFVATASMPASAKLQIARAEMRGVDSVTAKERQDILENFTKIDDSALTDSIGEMCRSFEPLARIDRLARIVALLNRYRDSPRRRLPDLPSWIQPRRQNVPAVMGVSSVFAESSVSDVASVIEVSPEVGEPEPPNPKTYQPPYEWDEPSMITRLSLDGSNWIRNAPLWVLVVLCGVLVLALVKVVKVTWNAVRR